MNGDLSLEVQMSIFKILSEDLTLRSSNYLNGPNVFDHVPDNAPPNFICMDSPTWSDGGDKSDPGQNGMFYVRTWTGERGNKRALLIAQRVVDLLHEKEIPLISGEVTLIRFSSGGIVVESNNVDRQAYRVFRIIVSEKST